MSISPVHSSFVASTLDHGRYELLKLIGSGTYGDVYLALDHFTGDYKAVKSFPKPEGFATQPSYEKNEITIHSKLPSHPNIVKLEKVIEKWSHLFMIMEYCPGGDLFENVNDNPIFYSTEPSFIKRIFLQILDAVQHCHSNGVFHRDLKPENILVDSKGQVIKLVDFGLATTEAWSQDLDCGSSCYMSPECLGGLDGTVESYSSSANDVWALGVILINLLCARNPWSKAVKSDPTFATFLKYPNCLQETLQLSPECNDIIQQIFEIDPTYRIQLPKLRAMIERCSSFIEPRSSESLSSTATLINDSHDLKTFDHEDNNLFAAPMTSTLSAVSWTTDDSLPPFSELEKAFRETDFFGHHKHVDTEALVADYQSHQTGLDFSPEFNFM